MRLDGKVAIVTGGARGIGAAIAGQFVREGAWVTVADRCAAGDSGPRTAFFEADIGNLESHPALIAATVERFGKLDILVNNAGIQIREPFAEASPLSWDRTFAVNLKGPFFLSQHAVRSMSAGGKIINIASVHDETPHRGSSIYSLTKSAMKMLTKCLALELAPLGIDVNSISPGAIATGMNQDALSDPDFRDRLAARIPLGRIGKPEDIAGAAVYLASAESDYMTGTTIYVDGGLLLR
jgi:glucose 1-dehydrogenase